MYGATLSIGNNADRLDRPYSFTSSYQSFQWPALDEHTDILVLRGLSIGNVDVDVDVQPGVGKVISRRLGAGLASILHFPPLLPLLLLLLLLLPVRSPSLHSS